MPTQVQTRLAEPDEIARGTLKINMMEAAKKVCDMRRGPKRQERDTWWWAEYAQTAVEIIRQSVKKLQKNPLDGELNATQKAITNEANRTLVISKESATQNLYHKLNIKEGKDKIYKIVQERQRSSQVKQSADVFKDKDGKVLLLSYQDEMEDIPLGVAKKTLENHQRKPTLLS